MGIELKTIFINTIGKIGGEKIGNPYVMIAWTV